MVGTKMSKQILVLDSSQISTFLECPQKQEYRYAQNLVPIDPSTGSAVGVSDKIQAGTLGHRYLEIYYNILASSKDATIATRRSLDFDLDAHPNAEREFPSDPTLRKKIKERFRDYLVFYAGRDYTVALGNTKKVGVIDGQLADIYEPKPLVERGFSFKLLDTPEYLFVLEGRIDFIGSANGELFFMDHKWQFSESELYSKSVQFRNYALVTGLSLGIINYIRLHNSVGPKTFVRQPLCFSAADSLHWKNELIEIYTHIAKQQSAEGRPFKNRFACAGRFNKLCPFISLCDALSENERHFLKESRFTTCEPWHPWNREEN